VLGISIGVATIVALGAMARGLREGFAAMTRSSEADLVLSQSGAISVLLSSVDESIADELRAMPEIAAVDGVLLGQGMLNGATNFFLFGYDPHGFAIEHFRIVKGQGLAGLRGVRGKPLILGRRAADNLEVGVGDTLNLSGSVYRIVGVYETGDSLEDGAAVVPLRDAQELALQQRRVSMIYLKLRSPGDADRVRERIERRYPDLSVTTTAGFVDQEQMFVILDAVAMGIAGLAVVIGGIGMANTLLMSVFERTREIGILRSLGWRKRRVMALILGESLVLALMGGVVGSALGVAGVYGLSRSASWAGIFGAHLTFDLFIRALVTVLSLGMVGGAYPAWWASRLLPLEALRYEGGSEATATRIRVGGMTARNLLRRRTRTLLTLLGIGVSIAAVVALSALAEGMARMMSDMWGASQTDLFAIQADMDADYSALDERLGAQLAARSDVRAVAGLIWTAVSTPEVDMLMVFGYHPREYAIRRFRVVEGAPLSARHQVLVGRQAAEQMGVEVGDTMRLLKSSFRVAGIYETGLAYQDNGVVIGLREAQALTGKSHQVMYYEIKLEDPRQAEAVREALATAFPSVDFSLASKAAESMSDFAVMEQLVGQISFLAVLVGGLGMLNTMLMSVLERTREIGVLRALGWRRRQVLGQILGESLLLGGVGGVLGALLGVGLGRLMRGLPGIYGSIRMAFTPQVFAQALAVALIAGVVGGMYPAWRATRMRPVEALRYE